MVVKEKSKRTYHLFKSHESADGFFRTEDELAELNMGKGREKFDKQVHLKHSLAEETHRKTRNMGSTMPIAEAHLITSTPQAFNSPNPPDVLRLTKGVPIVGLV
jgi:hypothetical protein